MATMTIRCDEKDKREAARVAEYYGFDLSSVTRAFWKQMGRTGRIPLDLGNEEPNEETRRALVTAEAKAMGLIPDDVPGFTDADELVAFLDGGEE